MSEIKCERELDALARAIVSEGETDIRHMLLTLADYVGAEYDKQSRWSRAAIIKAAEASRP